MPSVGIELATFRLPFDVPTDRATPLLYQIGSEMLVHLLLACRVKGSNFEPTKPTVAKSVTYGMSGSGF